MRNSKGQFIKGNKLGLQKGHKINVGRKLSEESKQKIGAKNKENTKRLWENVEYREHMSRVHTGHIHSEEQKIKISLNGKGKAKPQTEEHRQKNSEAHKGLMTGDKHPNWQGGITPYYRILRVARLKSVGGSHTKAEWETLKAQYNWTCPCCKGSEIKLTKDHIIPVSKGGSDNIENIQPLCGSCNSKKNVKDIKYDYKLTEENI